MYISWFLGTSYLDLADLIIRKGIYSFILSSLYLRVIFIPTQIFEIFSLDCTCKNSLTLSANILTMLLCSNNNHDLDTLIWRDWQFVGQLFYQGLLIFNTTYFASLFAFFSRDKIQLKSNPLWNKKIDKFSASFMPLK